MYLFSNRGSINRTKSDRNPNMEMNYIFIEISTNSRLLLQKNKNTQDLMNVKNEFLNSNCAKLQKHCRPSLVNGHDYTQFLSNSFHFGFGAFSNCPLNHKWIQVKLFSFQSDQFIRCLSLRGTTAYSRNCLSLIFMSFFSLCAKGFFLSLFYALTHSNCEKLFHDLTLI